MSSGFLDPDGPLTGANDTIFWLFAGATMAMVAASVVIALWQSTRLRSALPLVVLASAALWLPNEPFIDQILGFQYAADAPAEMFTLAGRPLPISVLGVGAMFFLFPWLVHRMIVTGRSVLQIAGVCIIGGLIDWPLEWMAIAGNLFQYYGDNPSRILGLPLTSMVQNCFIYMFMGVVITLAAPYLRGWRAVLFGPVIPGCYYAYALIATWPYYLALHLELAWVPFMALSLLAAAANAYIPLAMMHLPEIRAYRRDPEARPGSVESGATASDPALAGASK